jgi:hypothetical protein
MRRHFIVFLLLIAACGREQSVASKSAAAYREAAAKGTPVGGGHDHGHHGAATATSASTAIDHSAHGAAPAAMDHSAHGATATTNAHAQHGTASGGHAGHTSSTRAASHDQHAGMQHSTPTAPADPHAQHRQTQTAAAPVVQTAPTSNTEMQRVQPAATLQPDSFDAPAAVSMAEAAKALQGGGQAPATAAIYACPMHPEVTSDKPGNCPKCGMALVKKN